MFPKRVGDAFRVDICNFFGAKLRQLGRIRAVMAFMCACDFCERTKKWRKNVEYSKRVLIFATDFRTRGVAQLVSAPRSGRGGRKFESSHPDNPIEALHAVWRARPCLFSEHLVFMPSAMRAVAHSRDFHNLLKKA